MGKAPNMYCGGFGCRVWPVGFFRVVWVARPGGVGRCRKPSLLFLWWRFRVSGLGFRVSGLGSIGIRA